jgi:hypothetical protein
MSGSGLVNIFAEVTTRDLNVNGPLTISNGQIFCDQGFANVPRLTRRKYAQQAIQPSTDTIISWESAAVSYPFANITLSDPSSFLINSTGFYLVTWTVDFGNSSTSTDLETYLNVEPAANTQQIGKVKVPGSPRGITVSSSATVHVEAGRHVRVLVKHNFSNSLNVPSALGSDSGFVMQITIIKQM